MTITQFVARSVTPLLRGYIRYFPWPFGKSLLYSRVVRPYLIWRPYSAVAKMQRGAKIEISISDLIQSRIYFFGIWEPYISDFVQHRLSTGDCFIDVGANVGYYSLLAASIVGKEGSVCAIEPSPSIFNRLKRNVTLNEFRHIELFNEAASDSEGFLSIFLASGDNLGATTVVSNVAGKGHTLEATVPARTLSAIVGQERLLSARLIKIDVEGAEAAVLRGISHLLPKFSSDTEWIIEVTPKATGGQGKSIGELLTDFQNAGYFLYQISNDYSLSSYFLPRAGYQLVELTAPPAGQMDIIATKRAPVSG